MSRADSYHKMLQAAAHFQWNIALILEAKAVEAARSCQWICNHLSPIHFEDHSKQVKRTIEVHEQLIEVIDGLAKMESALAKNLQTVLADNSDDSNGGDGDLGDGSDDYGGMFSFGGNSK